MNKETIAIGKLYNDLLEEGYEIQYRDNYELIIPKNIKILTIGNKYVNLVALSRHKTYKHLIEVTVKSKNNINKVTVTTDHICMVYNDYNFFENKAAKDIEIGDYVQVYDENHGNELRGTIENIVDVGETNEYVYDCEVDDDIHSFYCNDILIHNSQFVNIQCITRDFKEKYGLGKKIANWSDEDKLKLWKFLDDFVENDVNHYVQNLIKTWYKTERPEVLRYSLEYVADTELMESKKHYACHKILSEGPEVVDKIKYSGIELKKANTPIKVKEYLSKIYNSTLTKDWNEKNFNDYIKEFYPEFTTLGINDISFWKGYGTEKEADGFLKMSKGSTGVASPVVFYNQLIKKLGIADKYEEILVGDKIRMCYIKPTNKYRIKYIAFKDEQYPTEFDEIFSVDYETMFEKLIVNPLKNFLIATRWHIDNPNNANLCEVDDL